MDRDALRKKLEELATACEDGSDPEVIGAGSVLCTLVAALLTGNACALTRHTLPWAERLGDECRRAQGISDD